MTYLKLILLTLLFCSISVRGLTADSDVVVVVNKNNPTQAMTRSEVIDLFMGRYVAFPNGSKASPLDLNGEQDLKRNFYQSLVGMSLARVNSYWSRIKFTGRVRPLLSKSNEEDVIKYISHSKDAIGYVSRAKLNPQLKIVFELHE